jgi:hypothetical protein
MKNGRFGGDFWGFWTISGILSGRITDEIEDFRMGICGFFLKKCSGDGENNQEAGVWTRVCGSLL